MDKTSRVMDKAEEIKQKAKIHPARVKELTGVTANLYVFTELQLEQYAQQREREQDQWVAIEFATTYYTLGIPREDVHKDFDEWYDEWKSNQEERK